MKRVITRTRIPGRNGVPFPFPRLFWTTIIVSQVRIDPKSDYSSERYLRQESCYSLWKGCVRLPMQLNPYLLPSRRKSKLPKSKYTFFIPLYYCQQILYYQETLPCQQPILNISHLPILSPLRQTFPPAQKISPQTSLKGPITNNCYTTAAIPLLFFESRKPIWILLC